jgi:transposase
MYVGILSQEGAILLHRHMKTSPEMFLKAIAPYREDLVVSVAGLCTWSWLADLCVRAGIPCVLGPALYMPAIPGGKATNDPIDAQKIAVRLRGGMFPPAYGSPADMRATRDLLRRRMHLVRQRADLLPHVQHTNRQYNLPEMGNKIASNANRDGGAERFPAPAGPKSIEVALALIGPYADLRRDLALALVTTAKQPDAQPRYWLQPVPGLGKMRSLVLVDEIHDSARFPRGQDFVSSCRLGTCAQASAGNRYGPSGPKIGHASLKGAFSAAAVLFLRNTPAGQTYRARLEHQQGQGNALTVLAHQLARAV